MIFTYFHVLCVTLLHFLWKKKNGDCSCPTRPCGEFLLQGACAIFLSSVETAAKTFGLEAGGSAAEEIPWPMDRYRHTMKNIDLICESVCFEACHFDI